MNILILSCSTGGGHNSAAAAIREYFEAKGHSCETVNALGFLPKATAEIISRGHELAYKYTPKLYGAGYRMGEKRPQTFLYEQNSKGAGELLKQLGEGGYDAVVCVHIFAAMMMTELRTSGSTHIPSFFVATDYTCSPGAGSIDADAYFIPHPYLVTEFASQGIARERIVSSGIPVRAEFCRKADKRESRRELGIPEDGRVVLVCCGSMGCGPMRSMALRLADELAPNDRLVIVCGSNKQLYRDLELLTAEDERIKLYGFTDKMSALMDAADLMITKAGGLSTTEAVAKKLPIVYIDAVPGCESRNIEFMTQWGYAVQAGTAAQISAICAACLSGALDPSAMVHRREPDFPTDAAKTVYETVEKTVREYETEKLSRSASAPAPLESKSLNKRMLLIINPVAGKRMMAKNLAEAIGIFMSGGYLVTVMTTAARGDATEYVKQFAAGYDMICCSGGDGTMNEVVTGLVEAGLDIPVGYMPSGSTNDFAEFHGISTDVLTAARGIVNGKPKSVDVGCLDGSCFINVADFGAFTWLPYTTPQKLKNTLGFYAYILDAVKDISKLQSEHLRIEVNGGIVEGDFLFGAVASSSSLAGTLELFGEPVSSDDGKFEVVLVRRPGSPAELENTISALRSSNLNSDLIFFTRTDKLEVNCESKLDWAVDGEKCVCRSRHSINMLPGRLKLVH